MGFVLHLHLVHLDDELENMTLQARLAPPHPRLSALGWATPV